MHIFNETATFKYYSFERLWINGFVTVKTVKLPILVDKPVILDFLGNKIEVVSVGQTVIIQSSISNVDVVDHDFMYIDPGNVVISLNFIKKTIAAGQSLTVSASWILVVEDTYRVEIYNWKSFMEPEILSEVQVIDVVVSE